MRSAHINASSRLSSRSTSPAASLVGQSMSYDSESLATAGASSDDELHSPRDWRRGHTADPAAKPNSAPSYSCAGAVSCQKITKQTGGAASAMGSLAGPREPKQHLTSTIPSAPMLQCSGKDGKAVSLQVQSSYSSSFSPASTVASIRDQWIVTGEVIGGGLKGLVQKGTDPANGRDVAVKRVQSDKACPIRFLQLSREGRAILDIEGYTAAGASSTGWCGQLAYVAANHFAASPFDEGSLDGCVIVVRRGGGVTFADKLANAERGGAVGVLLVNAEDRSEPYALGNARPVLPSMMVSRSQGEEVLRMFLSSRSCGEGQLWAAPRGRSAEQVEVHATVRTDAAHEVMTCLRLRPHVHIVEVLDAWEDGDAAVVVMDVCKGGTVNPPVDFNLALKLVKQMLAGLSHLHADGICHRDLKTENVMLTRPVGDPDCRLVLVDFSMATFAKRMNVPCGSPRYIAPEVLDGDYDIRCDLWSAGVVAHELLCGGRHPYGDVRDKEIMERLSNHEEPTIAGTWARQSSIGSNRDGQDGKGISITLPDTVVELLRGLLRKKPQDRLSAAEAFNHPSLAEVDIKGGCGTPPGSPFRELLPGRW